MGAMPISGRRSRGEDGRPLRLRTPAIRRDGPTVQGPPAFSPAQCPRAGCRPILPQRTSGVMLKTPRVHASIWSRTLFQNAVFKLSIGLDLQAWRGPGAREKYRPIAPLTAAL